MKIYLKLLRKSLLIDFRDFSSSPGFKFFYDDKKKSIKAINSASNIFKAERNIAGINRLSLIYSQV